MKLHCFALNDNPPKILPARASRRWMDAFPDRHAYRCLPLTIANAHGWDLLCPSKAEIIWNGGPRTEDLIVVGDHAFCRSHFSSGIVTFHTDYIFRTDDGWNLLASGPFNSPKDGASPLTGIMESNWLAYPFTMNWQITRPGSVTFEKDEPFCFIFPVGRSLDCVPEIHSVAEDPELDRQHRALAASRDEFMTRFHANDPATLKDPWLKYYFKGEHPDGTAVDNHVNKLRVAAPVDRRLPRS